MATRKDRQEAAALARRILDEVERGGIEAETQAGRRLRRRLEGAVVGLEADDELTTARADLPSRETDETGT